ncbi:MAG: aminotransferase class V-fold PLP-dependent enzyme, partial [Chloroflexi bacterium]|nr:aminotransferase class V-fold PLP-dependent enzyme [Chloroflexota bacterium]
MTALSPFDSARICADFPILSREVRPGVPLIYLDSAATSQKPASVIEAMNDYYRRSNANIHRGVHALAEEATALYEGARERVAGFINARSIKEVIFTRNATEAINLVAYSWGRANVNAGDAIVITEMEHHSNLVPWQMLAAEKSATLEVIPVTDDGQLDLSTFDDILQKRPRLVCLTHMSNVLGTINPVTDIAAKAHAAGALVLVDGAQSVPHLPVDVQTLGADFLAFSGH